MQNAKAIFQNWAGNLSWAGACEKGKLEWETMACLYENVIKKPIAFCDDLQGIKRNNNKIGK